MHTKEVNLYISDAGSLSSMLALSSVAAQMKISSNQGLPIFGKAQRRKHKNIAYTEKRKALWVREEAVYTEALSGN